MKVVHLFKDFYPPTTGGIEQHMQLLCAGLARHVDVSVLVPSGSLRRTAERTDGIDVIRVPELGRYLSTPLCPTMPGELRRLAPDLVHLHFPNPTGDLAYLLSGWRAPVVLTYHADIVKPWPALCLYRPAFRQLERHVRRIIVSSEAFLRSSEHLSPYREKCVVIPFGIDPETFALRDREQALVERLARDHGRPLALFLGVLRPYKGLQILLRAMTKVHGRLLIAGRGPHRSGLEALAHRLGVAERVTFAGEVSESERRLLLHACDVFVLPSLNRNESFGIAQLEAMVCGKPVVSSDLRTGVGLVNLHQITGLLVPPGDPDQLASALNELLNDRELRMRLGKTARDRVKTEFTGDRMIAETLRIYDEILGDRDERQTTMSWQPRNPVSV
jgi:rhamnosyl/mannosyltransferase